METRIIRFYKSENRWYAHLPEYLEAGGTVEECEMVSGADDWLDFLSGNGDEITLELSSENIFSNKIYRVEMDYNNLSVGATYLAHEYNGEIVNHQLWICPVTLFVFGEYPASIYYRKVK